MGESFRECTYLSQDGLSLYYRDYGPVSADMTILCLPGLTRNCLDFHDLAATLADNHRVLTPDLRGRGKSDYDPEPSNYLPTTYLNDIGHLLTVTGCHHVVVIGTSLGGILAMGMAVAKPTTLRGVVLNDIGPDIDPTGVARIQGYVGKTPVPPTIEDAARSMKQNYGIAFPDLSDDEWLEQAKTYYEPDENGKLSQLYDSALADTTENPVEIDLWSLFNALRHIPLLTLRGELSDILAAETLAAMQAANPDMGAVTVPQRGHAPLLNEPVARRAILDFLAELSAGEAEAA